ASVETILGLAREPCGRKPRGLLVRCAGHDQSVQSLHVPSGFAELDGQPVEQLLVNRDIALHAEVLARLDETDAEERLPGAIDGDPRGVWVFGGDQPAGQAQAIA